MRRLKDLLHLLAVCTLVQLAVIHVCWAAQLPPACAWSGPPVEWVLARHLSIQTFEGSLGSDLVPFLQRHGIPVSLVLAHSKDTGMRIEIPAVTTVRDMLNGIESQAPGYRYRAIGGRLVIYPTDPAYDAPVNLGNTQALTRGAAFFFVLAALKKETTLLAGLDLTFRGGGWGTGKRPLEDEIEVGGTRTVIEHLVSLIQKRPSVAFRLLRSDAGPYYAFAWVKLVSEIEVHSPSKVNAGDQFVLEVVGKLADDSVVSLAGPGCEVAYSASRPDIVSIDQSGRASAHKQGISLLQAEYELSSASVEVHVD
jgi:hypothetical protein